MLSPFRFMVDMLYRGSGLLWKLRIAFPLERLHQLIHDNVWSDVSSQLRWEAKYPQIPYQLWSTDPMQGGTLKLQDVKFTCPWCSNWSFIPLKDFTNMHRLKNERCRCMHCGRIFNADTLSAKLLRDDLWQFLNRCNPRYFKIHLACAHYRKVRGVCIDSLGRFHEADAANDLHLILNPYTSGWIKKSIFSLLISDRHRSRTPSKLCDAVTTESPSIFTWEEIFKTFQATAAELRERKVIEELKGRSIFTVMRTYYRGIVWRGCSLDLVGAALRQREFTRKITANDLSELHIPKGLDRAIARYQKFMLLANRVTKYQSLVPTLDIDLCWHTHQLSPLPYSEWCYRYLQRWVNHDDTIGDGDLRAGLHATSMAWWWAYKKPYATDHLQSRDPLHPEARRHSLLVIGLKLRNDSQDEIDYRIGTWSDPGGDRDS